MTAMYGTAQRMIGARRHNAPFVRAKVWRESEAGESCCSIILSVLRFGGGDGDCGCRRLGNAPGFSPIIVFVAGLPGRVLFGQP
ncbi:MAG: hypothetical protein ACYCT1_14050 [Steroidobacteraceae bacterium]